METKLEGLPSEADKKILRLAKRRLAFRQNLLVYLMTLLLIWTLWIFGLRFSSEPFPWPTLVTIVWGVVIVFLYYRAFIWGDREARLQKEIDKINQNTNS